MNDIHLIHILKFLVLIIMNVFRYDYEKSAPQNSYKNGESNRGRK